MTTSQPVTDNDILTALLGPTAPDGPSVADLTTLVTATLERKKDFAPPLLVEALVGRSSCIRDYNNGGIDQIVWNQGVDYARRVGQAWYNIGAVEHGELLLRLSDDLARFLDQTEPSDLESNPVEIFLEFRRAVGGPEFGVPDLDGELAEAMAEWAYENADSFGAGIL